MVERPRLVREEQERPGPIRRVRWESGPSAARLAVAPPQVAGHSYSALHQDRAAVCTPTRWKCRAILDRIRAVASGEANVNYRRRHQSAPWCASRGTRPFRTVFPPCTRLTTERYFLRRMVGVRRCTWRATEALDIRVGRRLSPDYFGTWRPGARIHGWSDGLAQSTALLGPPAAGMTNQRMPATPECAAARWPDGPGRFHQPLCRHAKACNDPEVLEQS